MGVNVTAYQNEENIKIDFTVYYLSQSKTAAKDLFQQME